ncbi:MAG: radical SAM protein, partial [Actinomycetota bacterium]
LLDRVDGPVAAADLLDVVTSPEELADRLARLVRIGRLLPAEPSSDDVEDEIDDDTSPDPAEPSVDPTGETAPAPTLWSRALGRLRRSVGRDGTAAPVDAPPSEPTTVESAPEPVAEPAEETATPTDAFAATGGQIAYLDSPSLGRAPADAVPVYAVWKADTGPQLSLGMLTATARAHRDGALNETFEIRRPEEPISFLAELVARPGPGVLLLSNYVWTTEHNLDLARHAKSVNPELLIIHGGPSTPKYEADCRRFFERYGDIVDVAVRGEGELTLAHALEALGPSLDLDALADVPGLTYRAGDGEIVRNDERERMAELDELPSAYLTGEFDHLDPSCWHSPSGLDAVVLESNRGCPYGCTFCDWGSATMSRIRKFDLDRVEGEMDWLASRNLHWWMIADANFGIMSRDVDLAARLVEVNERYGFPVGFAFNVAKNTTKHLTRIIGMLVDAHITPNFSLSLQSTDPGTLEAIQRQNISTDHYVALAASFRRVGLPLHADLMLGLPGQTVDSFTSDLQFLMDNGMTARVWISVLLPNAPMNDPDYREEFAVAANDLGAVVTTSTFDEDDRRTMRLIQDAYVVFERHAMLRLVLRHVQWDHGIAATTVLRDIVERTGEDPQRYPLLRFALLHFHRFRIPPASWDRFYAEVRRFLADQYGLEADDALDAVFAAQRLLVPDHGRAFPASVDLAHDVVAYYRDRTAQLWVDEAHVPEPRPLADYGPGTFTAYGDPLNHCTESLQHHPDPYDETMQSEHWVTGQWELDTPVVFGEPAVTGSGQFRGMAEQMAHWGDTAPPAPPDRGTSRRVALSTRTADG